MEPTKGRIWRSLLTLALLAGWIFTWEPGGAAGTTRAAGSAPEAEPVWGRKPVMAYFLLTPALAERLQREVGLTEAQFASLQEYARQEQSRLVEIERQEAARFETAGEGENSLFDQTEAGYEAAAFNRQVRSVVQASARAAESALGAEKYEALTRWINARWEVERELHGAASAQNRRSYEVYATRFDAGGAYTVALPDKCLKIANGGSSLCRDSGYESGAAYQVRIEYQDSVRVTVGESGPWNVDDNFWSSTGDPQPRRMFIDLPRGMPAAQAAYFDDYNNGLDQFGRMVTSPVAIDLARQVSVDIGLQPGTNDWVTVTFLWTENWGEEGATVVAVNEPTRLTPPYSGDMCGSAWHRLEGYGGSPAYLTLNVASAGEATNGAEWVPNIPKAGRYRVQAFIPDHPPIEWQCPGMTVPRDTGQARYRIRHANGETTVQGNQGPLANLWLDLGEFNFEAGTGASVALDDLTGEESYSRTVAFSAIRFVSQDDPAPTPQPSPTAIPSPTPTPLPPEPALWAGSLSAPPGEEARISLWMNHIPSPGLGEVRLELKYDPQLLYPTACQPDPGGKFTSDSCQVDYEADGSAPDSLLLSLSTSGGVSGEALLARVTFLVSGSPGESSGLELVPQALNTPGGGALEVALLDGRVCARPCGNIQLLPWLLELFGIGEN